MRWIKKFISVIFLVACSLQLTVADAASHAVAKASAHRHAKHKIQHKHVIKKQAKKHGKKMRKKVVARKKEILLPVIPEEPPLINNTDLATSMYGGMMLSAEKKLVNLVNQTVSSLRYSAYKLGGRHFDAERGVYILDCSSFVDRILQESSPHAYSSLVDATGAEIPVTQNYYRFFHALSYNPNNYWNKVEGIEELRAGDILVFRYRNSRGRETGGHVMIVMEKPVRDSDIFFVRVADSASSAHSEDTRQPSKSGIGIGTLLLKANPKTGEPSAFSWGESGYWRKNVNFAMARPLLDTVA